MKKFTTLRKIANSYIHNYKTVVTIGLENMANALETVIRNQAVG